MDQRPGCIRPSGWRTMTRLHSGYASIFLGLTILGIAFDALDASVWARGAVIVAFLVVEAIGAFVRRKPGDTWSEINWHVLRGRPALYPVAIGWVGWYLWQWVEVFPWGVDPGTLFLAAGVLLWYPAHLIWEGSRG